MIRKRSRLVNRNVIGTRCRTSIRLEPEFWRALDQICERECVDRKELVRRIEDAATESPRTSAVRVFILEYFRSPFVSSHPVHVAPVGKEAVPGNGTRWLD